MRRRIPAALLALCIIFSLTGCGGEKEPEVPPPVQEVEPGPVAEPDEPAPEVPAGTNPLTGLPLEPEDEDRRPVAVMFNNIKAAQPQLGLSQADIVYEVAAEGGITRMLGVFQTLEGVEDLGSIRSTRPYYLELALGHDALLVHAGGSPAAYEDIRAWGVDNMDGVRGGKDAEIFWRDPERRKNNGYEHSLLTSGEKIQGYLDDSGLRTRHQDGYQYGQTFTEDMMDGAPAEHVEVVFSSYKTGVFDYDSASGTYLASQYGEPQVDGGLGVQVSAADLLVLETKISLIPGDEEGRLRVDLTGGSGTYFCGGKAVPIRWSKADRDSPIRYELEDGTPLALARGKSYVCIIGTREGKLSYR